MSKRAIFEDVGGGKKETLTPQTASTGRDARGAIAVWLWVLALLVGVMVLVGGMTRLTDSGLSITVWDPVMGAIPPLSEADWQVAFEAYKTTTEFQQQNYWMTLEDFRPIFWWEWGHRFLGRFIGLVWVVGFLGFLVTRMIPRGWGTRLLIPGLLGGVQGAVGWWMVASGLTGRLDVAPYRLAAHLVLAFLIFALLAWYAMRIRLDEVEGLKARRRRMGGMGWTGALLGLVFAQLLIGALVAGTDAGRGYVDWPLMQGQFLPDESFDLVPLWHNFFENPALVQFMHRMVGYLVLLVALAAAVALWRMPHPEIRSRGLWVGIAVLAQVVIGIVTVMHASPWEIAIFHQAGALVVIWLIMRAKFAVLYPSEQRIARGPTR